MLTLPDMLNPVPPTISPLTPTPPVTLSAPDVEDVAFVLESIETAPTSVEEPWIETPEAAKIILATLSPVPMLTLPDTPNPPTTCNAPEVEEVEFVLLIILTTVSEYDKFGVPDTAEPFAA